MLTEKRIHELANMVVEYIRFDADTFHVASSIIRIAAAESDEQAREEVSESLGAMLVVKNEG